MYISYFDYSTHPTSVDSAFPPLSAIDCHIFYPIAHIPCSITLHCALVICTYKKEFTYRDLQSKSLLMHTKFTFDF